MQVVIMKEYNYVLHGALKGFSKSTSFFNAISVLHSESDDCGFLEMAVCVLSKVCVCVCAIKLQNVLLTKLPLINTTPESFPDVFIIFSTMWVFIFSDSLVRVVQQRLLAWEACMIITSAAFVH